MKKISILIIAGLFSFVSEGQIKFDAKNLKKIKNVANALTDDNTASKKTNENTNSNVAAVTKPNNSNNSEQQPTPAAASTSSGHPFDFAGWTTAEIEKAAWTNAYLIDGGWMLDKIEPRGKYNDQMVAPVIELNYWSYCYQVPFTVHIYRMEDKELVKGFDFEAEATSSGKKGRYKSQMLIADQDRYILIFSYFSKVDANMDKYMEGKSEHLAESIPHSWK